MSYTHRSPIITWPWADPPRSLQVTLAFLPRTVPPPSACPPDRSPRPGTQAFTRNKGSRSLEEENDFSKRWGRSFCLTVWWGRGAKEIRVWATAGGGALTWPWHWGFPSVLSLKEWRKKKKYIYIYYMLYYIYFSIVYNFNILKRARTHRLHDRKRQMSPKFQKGYC